MSDLLSAYVALGLPEGTPLLNCLRRYRWLTTAFHPDRFPEDRKVVAETEMKKINSARELLQKHYREAGHKPTDRCLCSRTQNKSSANHQNAQSSNQYDSKGTGSGTPGSAQADRPKTGAGQTEERSNPSNTARHTECNTDSLPEVVGKYFVLFSAWLVATATELVKLLAPIAQQELRRVRDSMLGLVKWLRAHPADAAPWVVAVFLIIVGVGIKVLELVTA